MMAGKHSIIRPVSSLAILAMTIFAACSSTSSAGGGTSVSNPPTVSTVSLSPEFDDAIFETALTSGTSADESVMFRTADASDADEMWLDGPASLWSEIVLAGPVYQSRRLRRAFEVIAGAITDKIADDDDFELSTTPASYLVESGNLFGFTRDWLVRVGLRADNEELIKVVIRDTDPGRIWAYYVYERGNDGEPERGVFAFVNPLALNPNYDQLRFFALTYDISDSSSARLALTAEIYDSDAGFVVVRHHTYECDTTTQDCTAEFLRVDSAPPLRRFSAAKSVRLSWNDDSKLICLATVSYEDGVALGTTQEFIGPAVPDDTTVSTGACSIAEPFWAERVYSAEDLPSRFEDDDAGGFATALYGDGTSENAWESALVADTVDAWLMGMFE